MILHICIVSFCTVYKYVKGYILSSIHIIPFHLPSVFKIFTEDKSLDGNVV